MYAAGGLTVNPPHCVIEPRRDVVKILFSSRGAVDAENCL